MTVETLLKSIQAAGGTLEPRGDRLRVNAPSPLPEDLLSELRVHKAELMALLRGKLPAHVGDWPTEWVESYQERAGIMEFDGGLPTAEAEHRAEELVREVYRRIRRRGGLGTGTAG